MGKVLVEARVENVADLAALDQGWLGDRQHFVYPSVGLFFDERKEEDGPRSVC